MKSKPKMFIKILVWIEKCLILVIIPLNQNINDSNKLVVGKMKDETGSVAIKEFVRLKPKMHSFMMDRNSEDKKAKDVNKYVVVTISHNEQKDILSSQKCLKHLISRIQSKIIE